MEHLERSGFVVMKKPSIGGERRGERASRRSRSSKPRVGSSSLSGRASYINNLFYDPDLREPDAFRRGISKGKGETNA